MSRLRWPDSHQPPSEDPGTILFRMFAVWPTVRSRRFNRVALHRRVATRESFPPSSTRESSRWPPIRFTSRLFVARSSIHPGLDQLGPLWAASEPDILRRPQAYSCYRVPGFPPVVRRPFNDNDDVGTLTTDWIRPVAARDCSRRSRTVLPSSADYSLGSRHRGSDGKKACWHRPV